MAYSNPSDLSLEIVKVNILVDPLHARKIHRFILEITPRI